MGRQAPRERAMESRPVGQGPEQASSTFRIIGVQWKLNLAARRRSRKPTACCQLFQESEKIAGRESLSCRISGQRNICNPETEAHQGKTASIETEKPPARGTQIKQRYCRLRRSTSIARKRAARAAFCSTNAIRKLPLKAAPSTKVSIVHTP